MIDFDKINIKVWGGAIAVAIGLVVLAKLVWLNFESNQASTVSLKLAVCETSLYASSPECQSLLYVGISPSLYFLDKEYKSAIRNLVSETINDNATDSVFLGSFTLDHVGNKLVRSSVEIQKEFHKIKQLQEKGSK